MQGLEKIRILFVAGFGPIVRDADASRKLYVEALNIPFKEESGGYLHTSALQGAKEFALWPLSQAAESCFGNSTWPDSLPPPHAWLEFDVDNVESATAELESQGYRMLIKNKKEPWGQTVSRFLDPNGLLVGLTFTPSDARKKVSPIESQAGKGNHRFSCVSPREAPGPVHAGNQPRFSRKSRSTEPKGGGRHLSRTYCRACREHGTTRPRVWRRSCRRA